MTALSRRLALAGLAAALAPAAAHAQPYPNDTLIVPGVRIGGVYRGMTLGDLLALKGPPSRSSSYDGIDTYAWDGDLDVEAADRVRSISTASSRYALANGVGPGGSLLTLRAHIPTFYRRERIISTPGWTTYCYEDGVIARVSNTNTIDRVSVVDPANRRNWGLHGEGMRPILGPGDIECDVTRSPIRCRRL